MARITGLVLMVTGYRFSKYHRQNNTWQYRYLKTTLANIFADKRVIAYEQRKAV